MSTAPTNPTPGGLGDGDLIDLTEPGEQQDEVDSQTLARMGSLLSRRERAMDEQSAASGDAEDRGQGGDDDDDADSDVRSHK